MEPFLISPEDCLVVRALGRTKSLREAARVLECDPAALVRKVQKISSEQGLVQKIRGRWTLTESGQRAVQWVEESISAQRAMMDEKPCLRVSTTMWVAEQLLVPNLMSLQKATHEKFRWALRTSTPDFEATLLDGSSDYVIACHPPSDPAIAHKRVAPENWIAIVPASWKSKVHSLRGQELSEFLASKPYVRHADINPDAIIDFADDQTQSSFLVDSLIAVRSAVESGAGWSCVPEILVLSSLRDHRVHKVAWPVSHKGELCVWWLRARKETGRHVKALSDWLASIAE